MMADIEEFRRGWKVVLAASLGIGCGGYPLPFFTIGVFVAPLAAAFGWRADQVLFALLVSTVVVLLCGPLVGILTDRIGVRKVAITSTIAFGICLTLFALNPGSLLIFYANYALLTIVGAGTLPITWTRAVSNRFKKSRGLALGLAMITTGLFGALMKIYAGWLISLFGWRIGYVGLALFPLLVALPFALAYFYDGESPSAARDLQVDHEGSLSLAISLRTRRFWTLAVALFLITSAVSGIMPNLETMFGSQGFSAEEAVGLASLVGIGILIGRPLGGWLIDLFWAPAVALILLLPAALAFLVLSHFGVTTAIASFCVLLIGFASGIELDILAYLVARYFGMRSYSAIYGCLFVAICAGGGVGPYFIALVSHIEKSYSVALVACALFVVLGAASLLTLGKYPVYVNRGSSDLLDRDLDLASA